MFSHTRKYLAEQKVLRQARALYQRRGLPMVAYAMFRLNRTAQTYRRGYVGKERIYDLKNRFVRSLYARGYCVSVRPHNQNLKCHQCNGTGQDGWHDYESCDRCDGTGVFRTIKLYLFRFQIGDRVFSWHQPEQLVDWKFALTPGAPLDEYGPDPEKRIIPLRGHRLDLCLALVYVYLCEQGDVPLATPKTFRISLYRDTVELLLEMLDTGIWTIKRNVSDLAFNIRVAISERWNRDPEREAEDAEAYGDYLESQYVRDQERALDAQLSDSNTGDEALPF